jgi:AcrR family transcriptional regulator
MLQIGVYMPPKARFTKQELIDATLALIRKEGMDALSARNLGEHLGCSSRPIFTLYASMTELQHDVLVQAYALYHQYVAEETASGKYPPYKASGMAYIRFAMEEKELFKLLFMRDRRGEDLTPTADFENSVQIIMDSCGVSHEIASLIHMEMWACVHGIGTMLATSFLTLDWELISNMLTDVYQGIRERHLSEDK